MSILKEEEFTTCNVCYKLKLCIKREFTSLIQALERQLDPVYGVCTQYICEACLKIAQSCDFCQYFWKQKDLRSIIINDFQNNLVELLICPDCYFGKCVLDPYVKRKKERLSQV